MNLCGTRVGDVLFTCASEADGRETFPCTGSQFNHAYGTVTCECACHKKLPDDRDRMHAESLHDRKLIYGLQAQLQEAVSDLATIRAGLNEANALLQEAADSVHASLAETDISDERKKYRVGLEERLRAASRKEPAREPEFDVAKTNPEAILGEVLVELERAGWPCRLVELPKLYRDLEQRVVKLRAALLPLHLADVDDHDPTGGFDRSVGLTGPGETKDWLRVVLSCGHEQQVSVTSAPYHVVHCGTCWQEAKDRAVRECWICTPGGARADRT